MGLNRPDSPMSAAGDAGSTAELDFPDIPGSGRQRPSRSRAYLAAVAAAVVLLVGGLTLFIPGSETPALATVQAAAQATAGVDSGRITTTFSVSGSDGEESGAAAGSIEATFSGSNLAFAVDLSEVTLPVVPGDLPSAEARLIDGVLYLSDGTSWYSVATNGLIGQTFSELIDPRSVLPTVQELTETTEVGTAEVSGVTTTQYQSAIDLGDESLSRSGWLAMDWTSVEADGEVVIDLFVDDDGLLRRLDVSGDVSSAAESGEATFTVSNLFTDFGTDISIEAPAGAVELDPFEHMDG